MQTPFWIPGAASTETIEQQISAIAKNQSVIGYYLNIQLANFTAIETGTSIFEDFQDETNIESRQNFTYDGANTRLTSIISNLIAQGTGTGVGNMKLGGGIPFAFDGTKTHDFATGARGLANGPATYTYVGKDWGVGNDKIPGKVTYWPSSDKGYRDGVGGTVNLKFFASTTFGVTGEGEVPSGTIVEVADLLGFADTTDLKSLLSTQLDTAYRYFWAGVAVSGGVVGRALSEIEFEEHVATPRIVTSTVKTFTEAVSEVQANIYFNQVDSLDPADFVFEVSRDSGTTWTAVPLFALGIQVVDANKILTGTASLAAQPVGQDIKYRLTNATFKNYHIEQIHVQKVA